MMPHRAGHRRGGVPAEHFFHVVESTVRRGPVEIVQKPMGEPEATDECICFIDITSEIDRRIDFLAARQPRHRLVTGRPGQADQPVGTPVHPRVQGRSRHTAADHVEAVRLESACRLLETTNSSIEQVAKTCGFGTPRPSTAPLVAGSTPHPETTVTTSVATPDSRCVDVRFADAAYSSHCGQLELPLSGVGSQSSDTGTGRSVTGSTGRSALDGWQ
jgi:hypothetical protein